MKVRLHLSLFVLVVALALCTTYLYGLFFSHPRYWEGTVPRVEATEVALVRSILEGIGWNAPVPSESSAFAGMFAPLKNKIHLEVRQNGSIVYKADSPGYPVGPLLDRIIAGGDTEILFYRYQPPNWNEIFSRWLTSPSQWHYPRHNHITAPFFSFFVIYLLMMSALGFFVKSSYLEKDVLQALKMLGAE